MAKIIKRKTTTVSKTAPKNNSSSKITKTTSKKISETVGKIEMKQESTTLEKIKVEKPKIVRKKSKIIRPKTGSSTNANPPKLAIGSKSKTISTKTGKISVQFLGGFPVEAKNAIKHTTAKLTEASCFSKEEIKGRKIENPIIIADPSNASNILPGAVFSSNSLLNTGRFVYQKVKQRKPLNLSIPPSNIVKTTYKSIDIKPGEDSTLKIGQATAQLISSNNFNKNASPNEKSEAETIITTIEDYLSLNIATSGFFMGISGENNFNFTSSEKRYYYLFTFEQECVEVSASQIESKNDLFTDQSNWGTDWFYISSVIYGRRLHVLVNSYRKLETFVGQHKGELNWGVLGGKFSVEEKTSNLFSEITIEAKAQGGAPFTERDPKKIDAAIKKYFEVPYDKYNIVPLAYSITNLSGTPAGLFTEAFLDEKNCLKTEKIRVQLSSIVLVQDDDGASDGSEQLYGKIAIFLYNDKKKKMLADGKTELKNIGGIDLPTGMITYGSEDSPLRVKKVSKFNKEHPALKNKYVDLTIKNLDYSIKLVPGMKEEDDFGDDTFKNQSGIFQTSIRNMLLNGENGKTFYFTHQKSEVMLTVEITPA